MFPDIAWSISVSVGAGIFASNAAAPVLAGGRGADRLDGGEGMADGGARRHPAGPPRDPIQVHGAGAAERDAAAELGAVHAEHVAQDPQQGHIRVRVDRLRLAVDSQSDHGLAECISRAGFCAFLGSRRVRCRGAERSAVAEKSSVRVTDSLANPGLVELLALTPVARDPLPDVR